MFDFYLAIAIVVVPLQFINHWAISVQRMRWVYPLSMIVYSLYFICETALAFSNPSQTPVLLFNIVNIWGFLMALKGYIGSRRIEK